MSQDENPRRFAYVVLANVVLDAAVIAYWRGCSERHYDYKCRSLGQVGGFVYGWHNEITWALERGEQTIEASVSFDKLDILAKLSEPDMPWGNFKVYQALKILLREVREEGRNLYETRTPGNFGSPFTLVGLVESQPEVEGTPASP